MPRTRRSRRTPRRYSSRSSLAWRVEFGRLQSIADMWQESPVVPLSLVLADGSIFEVPAPAVTRS